MSIGIMSTLMTNNGQSAILSTAENGMRTDEAGFALLHTLLNFGEPLRAAMLPPPFAFVCLLGEPSQFTSLRCSPSFFVVKKAS